MKFGVVNKSTILNRFVLHTLQRNITHIAVITRKTNIKLGILKGGNWKRAEILAQTGRVFVLLWESSENQFGLDLKNARDLKKIFLKIRPPSRKS